MKDDAVLEWATLRSVLGPCGVGPLLYAPELRPGTANNDFRGSCRYCVWRLPSDKIIVYHGLVWIDSVGVVHVEPSRGGISGGGGKAPKEGWVLTVNERAVTDIGPFTDVMAKLLELFPPKVDSP